ncbi:MAG: YtxH domain-containing protein [Acidobacteriota bacterium]
MENGKLNLVVSFVAGGVLGAGVALLFAPQSGKKTRRDIARVGEMGLNRCRSAQLEFKRTVERLVDNVGEKVEDSLAQGKEWTKKTRDQVQRVLHSAH